jgi:hypothetical protein
LLNYSVRVDISLSPPVQKDVCRVTGGDTG